MKYFVYRNTDGAIIRWGECPEDSVRAQARAGETARAGEATGRTHYADPRTGATVAFPPKPTEEHVWDYTAKAWMPPSFPYDFLRRREYPPIGDQLDALWKIVASLGADMVPARDMLARIHEVKVKYPKVPNNG